MPATLRALSISEARKLDARPVTLIHTVTRRTHVPHGSTAQAGTIGVEGQAR
jgi:hypothetical protein